MTGRRGFLARMLGRTPADDAAKTETEATATPVNPPAPKLPVFAFDEAPSGSRDELRELLGGKGAALVEMKQALDLPVPPGFILGTPLCRSFLDTGWPDGLDAALKTQISSLEARTNRGFGDDARPLFLAVRSGAPISMPGMMDTVLNLGANADTIAALDANTGDERFALDTWSRFCRMYAGIVVGISADELGQLPEDNVAALRADVERIQDLCAARHAWIPYDPMAQLRAAIEAVFQSSRSERAAVYRRREGIAEDIPTAVVVQAMVFGNMGATSGTGVAFTRDPSTGDNEAYGDFLLNAQGEDVVAGLRTAAPLAAMRLSMPALHQELLQVLERLDRHFGDMCDVEFTVEEERLFILQTRIGKRSAIAAARIAIDLANDPAFDVSREDALRRVSREQWHQLQATARIREGARPAAHGVAASPGVVQGVVCTDPNRVSNMAQSGQSVILVRPYTSPEDVHGMVDAAGILTATGGMVSHAALVARSWNIAAVCGVSDLNFEPTLELAGHSLSDGDVVTIDGNAGAVFLGDCVENDGHEPDELSILRQWAEELGLSLEAAPSDDPAAPPGDARTVDAFELVRTVALLGFCSAERLAETLMLTPDALQDALSGVPDDVLAQSPRGTHLTEPGKHWLAARLTEERATVDADHMETIYAEFMALDGAFKQLVTDWQIRVIDNVQTPNDHSDAAYDAAVIERLSLFHDKCLSIVDRVVSSVPRLALFRARFQRAEAAVSAGNHAMIASPLKDSYHTVWFELHEELIHLSGRDRAEEEAKSG